MLFYSIKPHRLHRLAPLIGLLSEQIHKSLRLRLTEFRDYHIIEPGLIPTAQAVPLVGLNIEINRATCRRPGKFIDKVVLALVDDRCHGPICMATGLLTLGVV